MEYNLHPIVVHFPIALLSIYSVIKILPFKKWLPEIPWRDIERLLLIIGVVGVFASLSTGEIAERLTSPDHDLVEAHSTFATLTAIFYVLLLAGEIICCANNKLILFFKKYILVGKILNILEKTLCHKRISAILALFGLISIFVTGLLGGVLVHGPTVDPTAPFVLKILGIEY
jgi:uncharacterized membrane protein